MTELYKKNIISERTVNEILYNSTVDDRIITTENEIGSVQLLSQSILNGQIYTNPRIIGGIFEGGSFRTANNGARVEMFPESDPTIGIVIYDDTSSEVFKAIIGGTDVGDIIMGDSSGQHAKWDKSDGTFSITGGITATTGTIGGWNIVSGYIYNLQSGTPTASPNDGLVMASGNEGIIVYENTEKRVEVGYLSAGVYGLRVLDDDGTTVLFEISDTRKLFMGGLLGTGSEVSIQGWTHDMVFSITDADTIAWSSGTITLMNGDTYSIDAGNTGNMAAETYVYLDIGTSITVLQTTTTKATAVGSGKIMIAICENATDEAEFVVFGSSEANIDGLKIRANSITANEIGANVITASEIFAGTITATEITGTTLSAIYADLGTITAGDITLDTSGFIKGGQTDYETGTGFWLGYKTDAYKFSIGNSTDYLKWTGSAISIACTVANAITIESGSDILLQHGGDIEFTSVTVPTACTGALAGAGAGNVDDGTHKYKVTYVNAHGETELSAVSNTVTVVNKSSDGQISLTSIATSSSGSVTSRKVYRTKAGGSQYYLLTTIADNVTTIYTDNTADASLGSVEATNRVNTTFGRLIVDSVDVINLGTTNVFLGANAGNSTVTGDNNTFVGYHAGDSDTEGRRNTFIGSQSGDTNTAGSSNIFIGYQAGIINTTGSANVCIGLGAGSSITTNDGNVFIGNNAAFFQDVANKLYIANASGTPLIYGEFDNNIVSITYNLGIDTTTFGTSARGVLAIGNGTVPSTSPINTIQIFSTDISGGDATLGLRTEVAVATEVDETKFSHKLPVKINGSTYYIMLTDS